MKNYYIEKIGRGIEGGYYDNIRDAVLGMDRVISERLADGWYQIHHEGEGRWMFIVLVKRDEKGGVSIVGYQIKEVEV
jgi:hypothetical protein